MAQAARSPTDSVTEDRVAIAVGSGGPVLQKLAGCQRGGVTLGELACQDSSTLSRWAASKAKNPEARENRAFAKVVLGLLEAFDVVDVPEAVPSNLGPKDIAIVAVDRPSSRPRVSQPYRVQRPKVEPFAMQALSRQRARACCI